MAGAGAAAGAAEGQPAAGAGQQLVQLQQLVAAETEGVGGGEAGPGHRALGLHDHIASADIPAQIVVILKSLNTSLVLVSHVNVKALKQLSLSSVL